MEFKGMNRNKVAKILHRKGYDYQNWNGMVLEASRVCAGVTESIIKVSFTENGKAEKTISLFC